MTALLMALILCVGMVSGTNKEVRAQSASQNSETQTASESDVTTENTANIAENTTKSAATVTHHEYTTEEVKETIQGIFEWAKSLTNADELIDKTFLEGADTSLNDWFAFAAASRQPGNRIRYHIRHTNVNFLAQRTKITSPSQRRADGITVWRRPSGLS